MPTAAGKAQLKAKGVIKLLLKMTFTPKSGTAVSKVLRLSLRAK